MKKFLGILRACLYGRPSLVERSDIKAFTERRTEMIAVDDELALWEELKEQVSDLLSTVDEKRSEVKDSWDEKTPEFDEVEFMLDDVKNYIEGRMFELWPSGYQFKRYVPNEWKPQAQEAAERGINYIGLGYMPTERKALAMDYIEAHGLSSMKYEDTAKAVREFRRLSIC